jgi:hypothetical protein
VTFSTRTVRRECEGHSLLRHLRPFLVHGFIYVAIDYVAIDESAKMYPLLLREPLIKYNHDSEYAGLCGNRNLGLIEVIPGLQGDKTDKQAQDDAKRC